MTMIPMWLNRMTLAQELHDLLFAMTDKHEGKFIHKNDVAAFDVLFQKFVRKLKYYADDNPRLIGREAGKELIRILRGWYGRFILPGI